MIEPLAAGGQCAMTLRQLVGQLFFVRPEALDAAFTGGPDAPGMTALTDTARAALAQFPVGGFVLFGKNITGPAQLRAFLAQLRQACALPPLFAVDEEGGRVARLAGCAAFGLPRYESMAAVAAGGDPAAARQAGAVIGSYLRAYGFGLDLAPVADVNTNPANPVIGRRAFSGDAHVAAAMVAAAVQGFHDAGVGCTLKHFPGHGDTAQDSHVGGAFSYRTWQQMCACEMLPFQAGIAAGADAVMAGHITAPAAGGDGLPASLSPLMLTDRLRGELGFTGVVMTDSLGMDAVRSFGDAGQVALQALRAGADVLLMPPDLPAAFQALLQAVRSGELPRERVAASVRRIQALKARWPAAA